MAAEKEKKLTPFGERLHQAADAEGTSVTKLGREHGFGPSLHRYAYGDRGADTFEAIERLWAISKKLHVNFEWLAFGEGPMRRSGRGSTPAEEAIVFARKNGAREDAIQSAWDKNKEKEKTWSVWEWTQAIDSEARHLDRAGVPRPEVVRAKQEALQRVAKKKAAQKKRILEEPTPTETARRRAIGER